MTEDQNQVDQDRADILAVHRTWHRANVGLVIEDMLPLFVDGKHYVQFNFNGLTYRGRDDKADLWRGLHEVGADITGCTDDVEPEIHIHGDIAYVLAEGTVTMTQPADAGIDRTPGLRRFRSTEIYRRSTAPDGPPWVAWHMHSSEASPEGRLRHVVR